MKQLIESKQAPAPLGTYSQAIAAGGMLYVSGQVALGMVTGDLIAGDTAAQLTCIFRQIQAIAEAANLSLAHTVKLTVFVLSIDDLPVVSEVMRHFFIAPFPARSVIAVRALPKGAAVEVEAILHTAH